MASETTPKTKLPLSHRFRGLDWRLILGSVIQMFRQNQRMYLLVARPAKSQDWLILEKCRKEIFLCVRAEWAVRSGLHEEKFPYSEEYVVRLYALVKDSDGKLVAEWEKECATRKPTPAKPNAEGSGHVDVDG